MGGGGIVNVVRGPYRVCRQRLVVVRTPSSKSRSRRPSTSATTSGSFVTRLKAIRNSTSCGRRIRRWSSSPGNSSFEKNSEMRRALSSSLSW